MIGLADEDTYLVGHSLGCPAILRYLEELPEGTQVGGVLLVAGFAEPLPHLPQLDSFTTGTWNDEKIVASAKRIVIINSDDDQAVPFFNAEHVRDRFGAELIIIQSAGHINEKAGFKTVPFVLEALKRLISGVRLF